MSRTIPGRWASRLCRAVPAFARVAGAAVLVVAVAFLPGADHSARAGTGAVPAAGMASPLAGSVAAANRTTAAIGNLPDTKVLMVGDSIAWTMGFDMTGAVLTDHHISSFTNGALPWCELIIRSPLVTEWGTLQEPSNACDDWRGEWQRAVDALRPDVVLFYVGGWEVYSRILGYLFYMPFAGSLYNAVEADILDDAIKILSSRGAHVGLVTAGIYMREDGSYWSSKHKWRTDHFNNLLRQANAKYPSQTSMVEMEAWLCPNDRCPQYVDGYWVRPDGIHFGHQLMFPHLPPNPATYWMASEARRLHLKVLGRPIGAYDSLQRAPGGARATGWVLDRDTADPTSASFWEGLYPHVVAVADRYRSDIERIYGLGPNHGLVVDIPLSEGSHTLCGYAHDATGGAPYGAIGCKSVHITGTPSGAWDSVATSPGSLTVNGWMVDWDSASPGYVHVYVDGVATASTLATASRSDIARLYPAYGSLHGFNRVVPVASGRHQVCLYAINLTGPGTNPSLGCRSVVVP
ncbi:MAG: hypothetical protein JJLCMIEE_01287 [Acidimicrobiales bacterium]|nr:hypothetical protein [Acidimicrobiales bacterium]